MTFQTTHETFLFEADHPEFEDEDEQLEIDAYEQEGISFPDEFPNSEEACEAIFRQLSSYK